VSVAEVAPVTNTVRDELKQEALELASAKNLLHAGRASDAYAVLVRSEQRFPIGALSEERELLLVEALSALGRVQAARARAQRFLITHPHSTITVRMRKFVDGK
jgi:outer membrane protein assembly factor BamD (BamD/ComL family)